MTDSALDRAIACIVEALRSGGTLYAAGNGGSHAHADHLVAELIGRFAYDRPPLRAVLLSSGGAVGSCIANDYGWESVYSRQVRALCKRHYDSEGDDAHDVLVVLSTSGKSANVRAAALAALEAGAKVVALLGPDPMTLAVDSPRSDWLLDVCQRNAVAVHATQVGTAAIQEQHQIWIHEVARRVEEELCPR